VTGMAVYQGTVEEGTPEEMEMGGLELDVGF
jgi:hypothetical protein